MLFDFEYLVFEIKRCRVIQNFPMTTKTAALITKGTRMAGRGFCGASPVLLCVDAGVGGSKFWLGIGACGDVLVIGYS